MKAATNKVTAKQRRVLLLKRINSNSTLGLTAERVQSIYLKKLKTQVTVFMAKKDLQSLVESGEAFRSAVGKYFPKSVANQHGATVGVTKKVELTPVAGNPAYLTKAQREALKYPQVKEKCIIHDVQGTLVIEYEGCIFASYAEAQQHLDEVLRPRDLRVDYSEYDMQELVFGQWRTTSPRFEWQSRQ